MRVNADGKRWKLVISTPIGEGGIAEPETTGLCDPPSKKDKKIYINPSVVGNSREMMDTVLHEVLHATVWSLDEEYVEAYATEAARILHALGYRRAAPDDA